MNTKALLSSNQNEESPIRKKKRKFRLNPKKALTTPLNVPSKVRGHVLSIIKSSKEPTNMFITILTSADDMNLL